MLSGNRELLSRAWEYVLDTAFPPYCFCCEVEGMWLCARCRTHLRRTHQKNCPLCTARSANGYLCASCTHDKELRQIISVFHFKQKGIQELVHALKYENIHSAASWMGRCMAAAWRLNGCAIPDLIIPIPLHRSRLRERGYNQAALLARSLCSKLDVALSDDVLIRSRKTPSQTDLSLEERKENILGCFALAKPLAGLNILLVDDVFTTGATLCEAARILKKGGAQSINALVFAHD